MDSKGDRRILPIGHILRASGFDELPQIFNMLRGDMSLVGPRPEVREFVELFHSDYDEILRVRPGITDLASLKYRDEAALLAQSENPEAEYVKRLLPDKIKLGKEYMRRSSLLFDLTVIFKTFLRLFARVV
jgi:lipopolysaccharide/colanic/teichoic acid biosynthesis glycosyltransferase